jgi:hypothetical protein
MLIAEVAEASRCSEVLLKKARVLAIGLPGKIKSIVNEGMLPSRKSTPTFAIACADNRAWPMMRGCLCEHACFAERSV